MHDNNDYADLMARAEEQVRIMQQALAQVSALEGYGEAADGRVRATVLPGNAIKDLTLDPRAMRLASEDLAQAVLDALAAANADIGEKLSTTMESAMPGTGAGLASILEPGVFGPSAVESSAVESSTVERSTVIDRDRSSTEQRIEEAIDALRSGIERP